MMVERILTLREMNRATLARQYLLERVSLSPLEIIKRLVALQGQVSNAPYIGLWTRLQAFEHAELTSLLESRQVVRASSLRGTLHIMAAEDYLLMQPILQPALSRNLHLFARQEGFDMERFCAAIRAYIQEQPRTAVELRAKMEELYPGMGKQHIADSVRMHLALIQPIPAGLWGFTGRPVHIEASAWLGQPLASTEAGLHQLILRYLAAFGPASVQDLQTWSGVSRLKVAIEELRPQLSTFRDEQGRELFDLPDAPRPEADTPAPVRFLPDFDNLLFGHADRRRVIADEYRSTIFVGNSRCTSFLVDGFVCGRWNVERRAASANLVIEPFEPLSPSVKNEVQEEGERLMRWISDDAEKFAIQWSGDPMGGSLLLTNED
ncbi:MAG: AlkZ family DNA glycosylase [Chloroflexi bacterium]|nr:AlkZ family DNA glycosylase [Chloroflexota bacterium]